MKYTLHQVKEGYVLTTDEKIKVGDFYLDKNLPIFPTQIKWNMYSNWEEKEKQKCKKVVASTFIPKLPKLNFSNLFVKDKKALVKNKTEWEITVEYSCKGIKIEGASCSYNQQCTYPNCGEYKLINIL